MNKTLLIIQREYLTKIRKKSFILMTLLIPLLILVMIAISLELSGTANSEIKNMAVTDQNIVQYEQFEETETALAIGMMSMFLIYFFILTYGSQVMRGVTEEKANRIVEIIISSVKPFELMMGKIIGIALVGLTQFLIWVVCIAAIFALWGDVFQSVPVQEMGLTQTGGMNATSVSSLISSFSGFNFTVIAIFFILYFLGGYLLYASLFAIAGAASDSETDTQQFLILLMVPAFFALLSAVYSAGNPNGTFAFWSSVIPFTAPVVMMVRIPFGVPAWEWILSLSVLLASFTATTWVAAKIYRTGILMYGKKVNYKEIRKWIRMK